MAAVSDLSQIIEPTALQRFPLASKLTQKTADIKSRAIAGLHNFGKHIAPNTTDALTDMLTIDPYKQSYLKHPRALLELPPEHQAMLPASLLRPEGIYRELAASEIARIPEELHDQVLQPDPRTIAFKPWGTVFAYTLLIVFIGVHSLQFVDIFVLDDPKVDYYTAVTRLLISFLVVVVCVASVLNGWRTVEINIKFQLGIDVIMFLITLAACIARAVQLSKQPTTTRTAWSYIDVILPFIQWAISIIGLVMLIKQVKNGETNGEVGMLMIGITTLIGGIISFSDVSNKSAAYSQSLKPKPTPVTPATLTTTPQGTKPTLEPIAETVVVHTAK